MTRRCSHCSNNGHNSRTCPSRGASAATCAGPANGSLTIFGVKLTDGSIMKKSASMGNLSSHFHSSSSSAAVSPNPGSPSSDLLRSDPLHLPDGYLSDDPAHRSSSSNRRIERKRGHPWTEDEHRLFLLGLQTLGKGDWRGISRNFVTSRTPTQVASHAQKYFIRQSNATRRKRRSSLFDIVPEMDRAPPTIEEEDHAMLPPSGASETVGSNSLPSLKLSLSREFDEPMETISDENTEETRETLQPSLETATMVPALLPAYLPVALTLWPSMTDLHTEENVNEVSHHEVLRPIPVLPKEPVNLNELVGMSQLSLGEAEMDHKDSSQLTLNLLGTPSRPSAFHASTPTRVSDMTEGKSNVIQTAR